MLIRAALAGLCLALTSSASMSAMAADTPSVKGASVYIIAPKNGDTVTGKVVVQFGLKGMGIAPAGVEMEGTGHHHLLVNAADVPERYTIPRNDQYKHFDRGQSESLVFLPPGKYVLTLQFGDGAHRSYGEKYRKKIEITVIPDKD